MIVAAEGARGCATGREQDAQAVRVAQRQGVGLGAAAQIALGAGWFVEECDVQAVRSGMFVGEEWWKRGGAIVQL